MLVKGDYSRKNWLYFLTREQYLTMGDNFVGGMFRSVCDKLLINQEFTPFLSPQFNGVAERRLGIIEAITMAAKVHAKVLFGHVQLPKTDKV